ncbi:hypothetical protein [Ruegeria sp. Alg231-54]|uniref:hypothetical protein n=1 Tax=Ruegeria sp. Alg231-54 TaxID=1922221 RepID=UPI00131EDAA3|nr:hypothetical protein [Ruegeria sp. Alg231-54]
MHLDGIRQGNADKRELFNHVSEVGEKGAEELRFGLDNVQEAIGAPSYSEFHTKFIERFHDPVKIVVQERAGYPILLKHMVEQDVTGLPDYFVASTYEGVTVADADVEHVTQNFYEFVFGPGQSTTATPLALETYGKLRDLIIAADNYNSPKEVAGFPINDGLDPIVASVGVLYDLPLTREQWIIAETVADYRVHKDAWGMAIPVAYAFRLLQGALLLSGDITDKGNYFVFGSGITLNTYSTLGVRGRSRAPLSLNHAEFFEGIHQKFQESGRRR